MLKLIPARGGVRHNFKGGDVIKVKRGSADVAEIRIENTPTGNKATLEYLDSNFIQTRDNTYTLTSHNIRNLFYRATYGCALYLVVPEPKGKEKVKGVPVDEKDKIIQDFIDEGEYIIWCPSSNLPPRVVLAGRKQAKAVAISMAQRHGKKFHWCRLMGAAESVTEIKVTE